MRIAGTVPFGMLARLRDRASSQLSDIATMAAKRPTTEDTKVPRRLKLRCFVLAFASVVVPLFLFHILGD
jgi:hypothetical protein